VKKLYSFLSIFFISMLFHSCSWMDGARRSLLDEDAPIQQKMVPQSQYDELLRKYENASRAKESENPNAVVNNDTLLNIKDENPPMEKISMNKGNDDLVET